MSAATDVPRWRWRLAHLLNRSKRTCWADLVSWAMRLNDEPLRDARVDSICRSDAFRNGSCYCGKVCFRGDR